MNDKEMIEYLELANKRQRWLFKHPITKNSYDMEFAFTISGTGQVIEMILNELKKLQNDNEEQS